MFFTKNFRFTLEKGLELVNISDLKDYLDNKINFFLNYENYSSKEERLKLIDEMLKMCDYDESTATFDYSQMPPIEGYNLCDHQPQMIRFYNLAYILGGICLNVFDKENNRIAIVADGVSGPISTRDMFVRAYNELINCKNNRLAPAYGATLIFATLFEKDLKEHTKRICVKQLLNNLNAQAVAGNIILTPDENELVEYVQYQHGFIEERQSSKIFDGVTASSELLYDLLNKYGIVPAQGVYANDLKKLIRNELTLNQLIQSQVFKDIADDRFTNLLVLIFGTSKLNLRNNLAHCNFTYINYYSIHITALLFYLFTMVSDESFTK